MNINNRYDEVKKSLIENPKVWLITGVAGFIGSNLLETLLKLNQTVIGMDNFSTGFQHNLDEVRSEVKPNQWSRFTFYESDVCNFEHCSRAIEGVDYVQHQAALGSVPRSIKDPILTNTNNVSGFLNMLVAAKESNVKSFIYASSSATYGDHPALPKVEENIGKPLSPYAVSKYVNELYADTFFRAYNFNTIGLRYFNVFGKRQDPDGAYAAVIPRWISSFINNEDIFINGDGKTSRDFCYIENTVQMNILASVSEDLVQNKIFNVACGERTSLNELFEIIRNTLVDEGKDVSSVKPLYRDFRDGDVRHSQANIKNSESILGYKPLFSVTQGLKYTVDWYLRSL